MDYQYQRTINGQSYTALVFSKWDDYRNRTTFKVVVLPHDRGGAVQTHSPLSSDEAILLYQKLDAHDHAKAQL